MIRKITYFQLILKFNYTYQESFNGAFMHVWQGLAKTLGTEYLTGLTRACRRPEPMWVKEK